MICKFQQEVFDILWKHYNSRWLNFYGVLGQPFHIFTSTKKSNLESVKLKFKATTKLHPHE